VRRLADRHRPHPLERARRYPAAAKYLDAVRATPLVRHAKTFAVDRSRIFGGSFNFDPRSARLNTEMGVVIESAALAARLSDTLDSALPRDAYELRLTDNRLEWIDGDARHTSEPGAGLLQRLWIGLLSLLPIEWLL
jgi:cardiolipin synthase C